MSRIRRSPLTLTAPISIGGGLSRGALATIPALSATVSNALFALIALFVLFMTLFTTLSGSPHAV